MKLCSRCRCEKPLDQFNKDRSTKTGLSHWCRECNRTKNKGLYEKQRPDRLAKQRSWSEANPDKVRANNRRQYENNREKRIAKAINRQKLNPDKRKEYTRRTYENNPEYYADKSVWRHFVIRQATPPWVDREAILAVYREARRVSKETGIPHEVDHIHPLQGENFCGLHVPWNLQILTRKENRSKGNSINFDLQPSNRLIVQNFVGQC